MKYVFEKYEFNNRGRIFLGFETVHADNQEDAKNLAQEKVGEGIALFQIFVPQDPQ